MSMNGRGVSPKWNQRGLDQVKWEAPHPAGFPESQGKVAENKKWTGSSQKEAGGQGPARQS